jgi:uncharacterized protein YciI
VSTTSRAPDDPSGADPGYTPVALARIRFTAPPSVVAAYVDAHRAYLDALAAAGRILLAGPLEPRTGGAVLIALPPDASAADARVAAVRDGDPYVRGGVAEYDTILWRVRIGRARLTTGDPAPEERGSRRRREGSA